MEHRQDAHDIAVYLHVWRLCQDAKRKLDIPGSEFNLEVCSVAWVVWVCLTVLFECGLNVVG